MERRTRAANALRPSRGASFDFFSAEATPFAFDSEKAQKKSFSAHSRKNRILTELLSKTDFFKDFSVPAQSKQTHFCAQTEKDSRAKESFRKIFDIRKNGNADAELSFLRSGKGNANAFFGKVGKSAFASETRTAKVAQSKGDAKATPKKNPLSKKIAKPKAKRKKRLWKKFSNVQTRKKRFSRRKPSEIPAKGRRPKPTPKKKPGAAPKENWVLPFKKPFSDQLKPLLLKFFKFQRLRDLWNPLVPQLRRRFPLSQVEQLSTLSDFESGARGDSQLVRLGLNKLEFALHAVHDRFTRRFQLMNLHENFVLFWFMHPHHDHSERRLEISHLLSSYLRRSFKGAFSTYYNLAKVTGKAKLRALIKRVVPPHMPEAAQEVIYSFQTHRVDWVKGQIPGLIRFSFIVDLFLISLYLEHGLKYFVDDLRALFYIFQCLSRDCPSTLLNLFAGLEKPEAVAAKADEVFGERPRGVLLGTKLEHLVAQVEHLVVSKRLLDKLDLGPLADFFSQGRLPPPKPPNWSFGPKQGLLEQLESEISVMLESPARGGEGPSPGAEGSLETRVIAESPREDRKDARKGSGGASEGSGALEAFLADAATDSVDFYSFGVSLLKRKFDFEKIKIEELSEGDKRALKALVASLAAKQASRKRAQMLFQMATARASGVKEYLRNLDLLHFFLDGLGGDAVPARLKLQLIQILYKVREMQGFLSKLFFRERAESRRGCAPSRRRRAPV